MRRLIGILMASGLLIPAALGQKPPAPPPPSGPPGSSPGRPTVALPSANSQPDSFSGDRVMYLQGKVATDDSTLLPSNVIVERVCDAHVRQQVYASSHGDFTMDLGTVGDTVVDASGDGEPRSAGQQKNGMSGIPRRALQNCEMRASASGFHSETVNLSALTPSESRVEVGAIVVHRNEKIKGATLNAAAYKAPKDAQRAYEKGAEAEDKGKLPEARAQFEAAVKVYPEYTYAWNRLGDVLQKQKQEDAAQAAYLKATAIDKKFLPPYFSLAGMAFAAKNWTEVLGYTRYILSLDSLDYSKITGAVVDLDSLDYAQAYFYNAAANFNLNRIDEAEKSGLQAERLDSRPRYPQLRLLLAEIFKGKNDYPRAIDQLQMYLAMMPKGRNADLAREELSRLGKMNDGEPVSEKMDQN